MAIEIVDFPIKICDFHSFLYFYEEGNGYYNDLHLMDSIEI